MNIKYSFHRYYVLAGSAISKQTLNMAFKLLLIGSFLAALFIPDSHCREVSKDCDLAKCITAVKDYLIELRSPSKSFSCRSLQNRTNSWCTDNCMHKYFPENFKVANKKPYDFAEYCEESLSHYSNTNWSCIVKHSFQLLTCYMNISSITTNDVQENMLSKQFCRKSLEYAMCPSEVLLSECGSQSVKVMIDLFDFVSNYLGIPSCGEAEKKEVSNIPVHYNLKSEHMVVAKCFDKHPAFIGNCFSQLIQDEIDLYNYLCGDYDEVIKCINFFYHKYGKECQSITSISHILLPKLFSFGGIKCKPNIQLQDLSTQSHPNVESPKPFSYEIHPSIFLSNHDDTNSNDETDDFNTKDEINDAEELNSDFSHQSWETVSDPLPSSVGEHSEVDSETSLKMFSEVEKVNRNNQNETESLKTLKLNTVDVNYLKTSSGTYLNCDRILFIVIYFIMILSIFHQS